MTAPNLSAVKSKNVVILKAPDSETPEHHLARTLVGFNYSIEDVIPQATQYLIYKIFQMCESPDPMTSLKGLELMGKTAFVGLFKDKVELNFSTKSDAELKQELRTLTVKFGLVDAL